MSSGAEPCSKACTGADSGSRSATFVGKVGLEGGDVWWICFSAASSDDWRTLVISAVAVEGDESSNVRPSGSRMAPSCDGSNDGVSWMVVVAVEAAVEGVRSRKPLAGVEGDDASDDNMVVEVTSECACVSLGVLSFWRLREGDKAEKNPTKRRDSVFTGPKSEDDVVERFDPECSMTPFGAEYEDASDVCDEVSSAERSRFRGISPRSDGVKSGLTTATAALAFVSGPDQLEQDSRGSGTMCWFCGSTPRPTKSCTAEEALTPVA